MTYYDCVEDVASGEMSWEQFVVSRTLVSLVKKTIVLLGRIMVSWGWGVVSQARPFQHSTGRFPCCGTKRV